ncbi:nuclear transport factor 2 family protein [Alcaligenes sp. SORT26]|uniref:nuclear transport factor 2 family protein n=1 Tax=Alcaligenes sp. SORT26 TaxID=2813780 RepID=UPI001A9E4416|nr:DUF4440 domain-containing protein [Alcaligenes sp. SORT26]QTC00165.1 nuclear transport factor 2 family protein [Alcaligenes sp. SORT26]
MIHSLKALILSLEERLFDRSTRQDVAELSELLADEFVEFGARGAAWDKAEVLESLPEQRFEQRRLSDFKLTVLAEDVVLVTYICVVPDNEAQQRSLRSSIWRQRQGRWQMVFHQGTRIVGD